MRTVFDFRKRDFGGNDKDRENEEYEKVFHIKKDRCRQYPSYRLDFVFNKLHKKSTIFAILFKQYECTAHTNIQVLEETNTKALPFLFQYNGYMLTSTILRFRGALGNLHVCEGLSCWFPLIVNDLFFGAPVRHGL